MSSQPKQVDDFSAWIEQGAAIHAKLVTGCGDPVELSAEEARTIAGTLLDLADELDRIDASSDSFPTATPRTTSTPPRRPATTLAALLVHTRPDAEPPRRDRCAEQRDAPAAAWPSTARSRATAALLVSIGPSVPGHARSRHGRACTIAPLAANRPLAVVPR